MSYLHLDDSEAKAKWQKWFQGAHFGKKLMLAVGFILGLASFLHFREINVEVLELNSTAQSYIIGQIDFEFPDVDAMMLLKQEQVRDIDTIYKIDPKQIYQGFVEFETYLVENQNWREKSPYYTFDEVHNVAEAVEKALKKWRFTDKRTLKKMNDTHISSSYYYNFVPKDRKNIETLSKDFWRTLQKTSFPPQSYPDNIVDLVISFFIDKEWIFQEDLARQIELREIVEESIPQKYTKFEAGRRIIDAGEKVSPRHIAILNAMKSALTKERNLWETIKILASILLSTLLTLIAIMYFRSRFKDTFTSLKKMTLLVTIILVTLALSKAVEYFLLYQSSHLIDVVHYPILVPFAAILITALFGRTVALFALAYLTVILSVSLAFPYENFLAINLVSGVASIYYAKTMHKRRDVFLVCGKVWLWSLGVILAFSLGSNQIWNSAVLWDGVSAFAFLFAIALIIIGFLPLLESIFDVMTDMSLIEYMDPNNELLRRLSLELPGTYQHCLVVGNLSEAAAQAIGANGLFCRVSTLYHDIGKLSNPHYFTENQLGGFNIHQLLTPIESTQVIMAHVHDGEILARKHHLPQSFIDIIKEHHGTTLVYYFYRKYLDQKKQEFSASDELLFRYAGPKPKTKESAIIMIADSVEATSRSIDEISEKAIIELVDRVTREKTEDGQLDECQLTFEELGIIKKSFIKTLIVTLHLRVKYPKKTEKKRIPIDGC